MLISADRDGSVIAHGRGVVNFPGAGQPAEVPDPLAAHLLAAGGFSLPPQQQDRGVMRLRKHQGGTEITHQRVVYSWPEDGSAAEVPQALGEELLRLGGFEVAEPEAAEPEREQEPTPEGESESEDGGDGDTPDADGDSKGDGPAKPARRTRAKSASA